MDSVAKLRPQLEHPAQQQASFCRVFSNATRVLILWALKEREMSVGEIAQAVEASLQNVSQHLSLMKEHGVVDSRREGHTIYYRLEEQALADGCCRLLPTNLLDAVDEIRKPVD